MTLEAFMGESRRGVIWRRVSYFASTPTILFAVGLLISTVVKLQHLGSRELWLDETYSAYIASTPFGTLLSNTLGDLHPPLFHILLWVWVRVVGSAQSQLRLFSVVLDALAIVAMFWSAGIILGRRFGGYAALLFAFTPMLFIYGMEVRSYMLYLLVLTLLIGLHWRFLNHESSQSYLTTYVIAGALLFYVHYLAILILLGLLVHAFAERLHQRVSLKRVCTATLLVSFLCLPGAAILIKQHLNSKYASERQSLQNASPLAISHGGLGRDPGSEDKPVAFWTRSIPVAAGFFPSHSHFVFALCALPLLTAISLFLYEAFRGDKVCVFALLVVGVFLLGLASLHVYATRYILSLIPLIIISLSRVVEKAADIDKWRFAGVALGTLVAVVYIAGFFRQANKPHGRPWQNVVEALQTYSKTGDEIVFSAPYGQVPFDYFARSKDLRLHEVGFPVSIYSYWNSQSEVKGWGSPIVFQPELEDFVAQTRESTKLRHVWLLYYEGYFYDPQDRLRASFSQAGSLREIDLPKNPDDDATGVIPLHLYEVQPATNQ